VKWALFAVALGSIIPLAGWLRANPSALPKVWMIIGALPFVWGIFPKREIAILGVPEWPGFTQGFDVSLLDLIIVGIYLSAPRARHAALPFKFSFIFYIGVVLLSAFQAANPVATLYYVWQLLRIFMMYAVVARACTDARLSTALLKGLAFGFCFQGAVVAWQRFVIHYVQVPGTFTQQNMLGLAAHFVIFPFFALLLSGEKGWQPATVPILGSMIDIFTASRATLGFAGSGFSFLFLLSVLGKWTARKAGILAAAVLVIAMLSPVAIRQFDLRESVFGFSDQEGRATLNNAAEAILSDNPMGIGANNLAVFANVRGYYERSGVDDKNRITFPHNIYWVTAAETGYVGIVVFIVFLIRPLLLALSCGWRNRKDRRGELLLGLATSLLIAYIHSYFEWIFFTDQIQYIFAIDVGIIAGFADQLGYFGASRMYQKDRLELRKVKVSEPFREV
jgi:O-antigen ligase